MQSPKEPQEWLDPKSNLFLERDTPIIEQFEMLFKALPHPYLEMVIKDGIEVEINKLSSNKHLEKKVQSYFSQVGFLRNGCYFNSYNLMRELESDGVKYVEGLVAEESGSLLAHAWISCDGRYFDPTFEVNDFILARDHGIKPSQRDENIYIKLIEWKMKDFRGRLKKSGAPWRGRPPIPPPFAAVALNIPHRYPDQYNFNHCRSSEIYLNLQMHYSELTKDF